MNKKYKTIIANKIQKIENSFINKKLIEKKLVQYNIDKPSFLLNKSEKLSFKTLNIKDDIISRNNNQYEEKKYDGKKLSKSIHKKLEYFNKTHKKNISLYKLYKSKSEHFSKYYWIFASPAMWV